MRWKMMKKLFQIKKDWRDMTTKPGFWIGKKLETGKTEYGFMLNKIASINFLKG